MTRIRASDFVEGSCDSGHAIHSDKPIFLDGRILFPCVNLRGSMVQDAAGGWAVMLEIEGLGLRSLYSRMTPDGARMCGEMLIKMAGEVDGLIADQASAAIEAARTNGGAQ